MELHNLYSTPYIIKIIKLEVSHKQSSDTDERQTEMHGTLRQKT